MGTGGRGGTQKLTEGSIMTTANRIDAGILILGLLLIARILTGV